VSSTSNALAHMPLARTAVIEDLEPLLDLFRVSDVSAAVEPPERAREIWRETLECNGVTVFVSEVQTKIVATCMLITTPNLLRRGRSHAFLENVVTHPHYQGKGHGRAVVEAALTKAWSSNCHHVLMQSGRVNQRVHRFYERCGFEPGLRTAYVARRRIES
jgi:GNAT superfamily N-acetyltransferase